MEKKAKKVRISEREIIIIHDNKIIYSSTKGSMIIFDEEKAELEFVHRFASFSP